MMVGGLGNPCETDPEDFQNVVRTWRDDLLALTGMIGREQPAAWLKTSDILADYVTKYPHTFPVVSRYSPAGLPAELGQKLKQHVRKDLGGGFKILVDENDQSRPKFQFVVPKPSAT